MTAGYITHYSTISKGLLPVLEQFKVENLIIPNVKDEKEFTQLLKIAGKKGVKVSRCWDGDVIILNRKTVFQVLNPLLQFSEDNTSSEDNSSLNNTSLVIKLIYGETELLFTGDAEQEVEEVLLNNGASLEVDVL